MSQQPLSFTLRLSDFDLSRLPIAPEVLRADPQLLARAISEYYSGIFRKVGGTANVVVTGDTIQVSWHPAQGDPRTLLLNQVLALLQRGNYHEAEPLLQSLHAHFPDDTEVLYNYGMMLSDQGELDLACQLLEHLVELLPGYSRGWTALGVAHSRRKEPEEALRAFKTALQLDPENPYALRNAAASIAEKSPKDALSLFQQAANLLPNDQQALLGLATCLLKLDRTAEADPLLIKCIELNPLTHIAEQAKTVRTQVAHQKLRSATGGDIRPDVVIYCLGAIERFRDVGPEKTKVIAFEIAMLGRNGFDINDPAQKYSLTSLPGKFSGLHLVSMMYTGFKQIAPELDSGIDFSREYAAALQMFDAKKE